MEQEFGVTIHARTEIVQIIGEEETCEQVRQVIRLFWSSLTWHDHWERRMVTAITMVKMVGG